MRGLERGRGGGKWEGLMGTRVIRWGGVEREEVQSIIASRCSLANIRRHGSPPKVKSRPQKNTAVTAKCFEIELTLKKQKHRSRSKSYLECPSSGEIGNSRGLTDQLLREIGEIPVSLSLSSLHYLWRRGKKIPECMRWNSIANLSLLMADFLVEVA